MLSGKYKNRRFHRPLWLFFLLGQCFFVVNANVVIQSITQNLANPVVEGSTVSFSITVSNPDPATFVDINIASNGLSVNGLFTNTAGGCSFGNGSFFCGQLIQNGVQTYTFTVIADPLAFPSSITFIVGCSGTTACTGQSLSKTLIFSSSGLTGGELAAAEALDAACDQPNPGNSLTQGQTNLLAICNQLDSADTATQISIFEKITPAQVPAQTDLSVRSANTQLNNVNARMTALRSGANVSGLAGLNLHYAGLNLPAELFLTNQPQLVQGLDADTEAQSFIPKTGVFINGNVSFGDKEDVADELGFDFNTNGITAGVDYRFSDVQIVGGAVGIVQSDSDFNGSRGNTDIRGLSLLAYSTYYLSQSSYLEAVISLGKNDFDNSRNIVAGPINVIARGDTKGTEATIGLGAGYDFSQGAYSFSPYGKINYVRTEIDGYSENSNTGLELTYGSQDAKSLSTTIGGQLTYAMSKNFGVILPTLRFDWTHEFEDDSRFITASFLNDPTQGKFNIKTASPDRDHLKLGIGASATFGAGRSAFVFYESLLGQSDLSEESVSGGFRWDF